jgi:hypothetical protein
MSLDYLFTRRNEEHSRVNDSKRDRDHASSEEATKVKRAMKKMVYDRS